MNTPPTKAHGNTGLRTVKTRVRPKRPTLGPGDVPLNQLRREVQAGLRHFWGKRPAFLRPAGCFDFEFRNLPSL
jgi:hypothetical protein